MIKPTNAKMVMSETKSQFSFSSLSERGVFSCSNKERVFGMKFGDEICIKGGGELRRLELLIKLLYFRKSLFHKS